MGHQAGPMVSYAENVSVAQKNKAEFQDLLNRALKVDVNTWPEHRQLNMAMQRRARWLLAERINYSRQLKCREAVNGRPIT